MMDRPTSIGQAWRMLTQMQHEVERLRGLIKTLKHMCRYDWIQIQDNQIKKLVEENARLHKALTDVLMSIDDYNTGLLGDAEDKAWEVLRECKQ
jgi:hypothetical protein